MAALTGDWRDLIVFCAGTPWDGNRFPDQHMAERLAAYGPVLYVDPPISHLSARRSPELAGSLKKPRLRVIAPNLARLTPLVLPGMRRPGMSAVSDLLTRGILRRSVAAMGGSVCAVVVAALDNRFGTCGERLKVLYGTDDFVAGAALMGVPSGRLRRTEARLLREADVVVACSPTLVDKWAAMGCQPRFIPNGVDERLFATTDQAPLPGDVDLPRPIAGFIGHLSERIDLALLEAVADRGCSLLLVGPCQRTFDLRRIDRLLARPNVRWVGAKPFALLPSYLRVIDVGLVPYADSAFNRGSFPLKTLEYLAGGRAAVATDLPAVRWLQTDLITVATGPAAFADAVQSALAAPRPGELTRRRAAFAASHSWSQRAAELAAVLGIEPGGARVSTTAGGGGESRWEGQGG
jgi:teichuronic acid biosynthesis glycosyltransferase TuaH